MTTFELTVGEYDDTKSLGEYPTRDDAHRALGVYALAHGDQALHPQIIEQPSATVWTVTREGDGWQIRRDGIDISSSRNHDTVEVLRQVEALAGTPLTWRITDDGWTFTAAPIA